MCRRRGAWVALRRGAVAGRRLCRSPQPKLERWLSGPAVMAYGPTLLSYGPTLISFGPILHTPQGPTLVAQGGLWSKPFAPRLWPDPYGWTITAIAEVWVIGARANTPLCLSPLFLGVVDPLPSTPPPLLLLPPPSPPPPDCSVAMHGWPVAEGQPRTVACAAVHGPS